MRLSLEEEPEYAFYFTYARKAKSTLKTLVAVAGQRWAVESAFQITKGECGLDHYEVRHWQGWYRHITLSMLALALLTVLRAKEKNPSRRQVPLSVPEIWHLLAFVLHGGWHGLHHLICCIGLTGDGSINSSLSSSTAANKAFCSSLLLSYNCSTKSHWYPTELSEHAWEGKPAAPGRRAVRTTGRLRTTEDRCKGRGAPPVRNSCC